MLTEAKKACVRLWTDESGVVLAMSVVIVLTLFVIACSVYAIGEIVRERIEVQNAADAAAYTAAVVQSDALSRIAAMNLAMGWTYVQDVKMHMDYIVDKWLFVTYIKWFITQKIVKKIAGKSSCGSGSKKGKNDWYAGQGHDSCKECVLLNKHRWTPAEDIKKALKQARGQGKGFGRLRGKIRKAERNIKGMNRAEKKIIRQLPKKIEKAVKKCLKANIKDTRNDKISPLRKADIRYALLTEPKKCFKVLKEEGMFLRMVFGRGTKAKALFGEGCDTWYVLKAGGIQRDYQQLGDRLIAEWAFHAGVWKRVFGVCVKLFSFSRDMAVRAEDCRDRKYKTVKCEPQILTEKYFERPGAIIVAVARRMFNPFQFVFPRKKVKGIFGVFTVPPRARGGDKYIWGVAASRAGYRDLGRPEGSYNPTVDSYEVEWEHALPRSELPDWWKRNYGWQGLSPYNLSQTDWDAVFLPLHRAWSAREPCWMNRGPASGAGAVQSPGKWEKETAGKILSELWNSAEWKPLYRGRKGKGLKTWCDGSGPEGMPGTIYYRAMEDKVYH